MSRILILCEHNDCDESGDITLSAGEKVCRRHALLSICQELGELDICLAVRSSGHGNILKEETQHGSQAI